MSGSVSLPDLIGAIRGQIPKDKCNLLEELVQRLQNREVHLNRQQFLCRVRDIAGEDAPALRLALKQLAVERPRTAADGVQPGGGDILSLGTADPNALSPPLAAANGGESGVSGQSGGGSALAAFAGGTDTFAAGAIAAGLAGLESLVGGEALMPSPADAAAAADAAGGDGGAASVSAAPVSTNATIANSAAADPAATAAARGTAGDAALASGGGAAASASPGAPGAPGAPTAASAELPPGPFGIGAPMTPGAAGDPGAHPNGQAAGESAGAAGGSADAVKPEMGTAAAAVGSPGGVVTAEPAGAGGTGGADVATQAAVHAQQMAAAQAAAAHAAAGGGAAADVKPGLSPSQAAPGSMPPPALPNPGGAPSPATAGASAAHATQKLEMAAAAVLVHAAKCVATDCGIGHCEKMKKIHQHFLQCVATQCAICTKLKPLTYIHAKHCTEVAGQCPIPYCQRAKSELTQLLATKAQQRGALPGGAGGSALGAGGICGACAPGACGGMPSQQAAAFKGANAATAAALAGGFGAGGGAQDVAAAAATQQAKNVQAQARFLLVLAHVMKCQATDCRVVECAQTKQLVTQHTRHCRAGDACNYPRCALSKRLMRHHRECQDQACPVCLPLRRQLAAAKMGAGGGAPGGLGNLGAGGAQRQLPPGAAAAAAAAAGIGGGGYQGGEDGGGKRPRGAGAAGKRKKGALAEEEADGGESPGPPGPQGTGKRRKKEKFPGSLPGTQTPGAVKQEDGGGQRKQATGNAAGKAVAAQASAANAEAAAAAAAAATDDVLESGFCVDVFFPTVGKRQTTAAAALLAAGGEACVTSAGEWRTGTVMRAHVSIPSGFIPPGAGKGAAVAAAYPSQIVYDVMIRGATEEKCLPRSRLRLVCSTCLVDKRTFKPPPMYCEKCLAGIHQRWRYWDEARDDEVASVKLCNRCFTEMRNSPDPHSAMIELVGRPVDLGLFVERKEKDRPEFVDNWVQCEECHSWHHWVCALFKGEDTPEDTEWFCEPCRKNRDKKLPDELVVPDACALPHNAMSKTLEEYVAGELTLCNVKCEPVTVRVVSIVSKAEKVNETVKAHMAGGDDSGREYPAEFPYRSKCVLAFQKQRGHDICFFAMYVQEYGSDCPPPNTNRVYISYLDSVRYFNSEPDGKRTLVYHAILVGYLQHVKSLGYTHAHIWVSPPKQGDDYIFYGHPDDMVAKRMGLLKLKQWYEQMLNIAKSRSIVADYQDMLEEFKGLESVSEIPLFSGDHWAASIHNKLKEESKKQGLLTKQPSGSASDKAAPPGTKAVKQSSLADNMVDQLTEEMKSMRNHFIVVTLHAEHVGMSSNKCKPPTPDGLIHDPDPLQSNDLVDSRATFLEKCQVFHWQFNEDSNAKHSTMMLLYYLHNRHRNKPLPAFKRATNTAPSGLSEIARIQRSRTHKIESAMRDWSQLLRHANEATARETWELPPEELFGRILSQINRSKRDILHDKYTQCKQPTTTVMARSVFIRVLKRIAESFISCLLNMQQNPSLQT